MIFKIGNWHLASGSTMDKLAMILSIDARC